MSGINTPEACLDRAGTFKQDAEQLLGIGSQWYAVAYFYAAFHTVRASLMRDPIFKDLKRLQAINISWNPDDRFTGRHKARLGGGRNEPPGVNDLVNAFYLDIQIEYVRLHSASVAVRYNLGLSGYNPADLVNDFETIDLAASEGRLVAP